ncbi:MAG: phosphoglucosamine mutase [Promethearchaeota archaeon]
MPEKNLIFTPSGIRGIFGKELTEEIAKKIAIAFGLWLKEKEIIIGRDTRPSGVYLEKAVIEGLLASNCKIINLGICPTPIIIYYKNKLKINGGIIISGSHNPPEWNALKLLSKTFLSTEELTEISALFKKIDLKQYNLKKNNSGEYIKSVNAIPDYKKALLNFIGVDNIKKRNKLKVVVDTGAGAGKYITPQILEDLGCQVEVINNRLDENGNFPRDIEPIGKNLKDLIKAVWQGKCDIGFAHDCDADRLAIVGNDFKSYPEDTSLALITDYILKKFKNKGIKIVFITNNASSLMFESIAEKYNAQVIRTSIGERYLVEKINDLIYKESIKSSKIKIFGGEGSCGGVIFPQFNNARDGIFAAAKIIEILVNTGEKISDLVKKLPKYYNCRETINIKELDVKKIIENVKIELISEGEIVTQIDMDLRFGYEKDWFILIHPSNTEPIIRVISEAKRESLARVYCETTAELIKLVISKLK